MEIVNRSRWSTTETIRRSNKTALLQHLIWEEVVARREDNMAAFRRGMSVLQMVELMHHNPVLTKPLLIAESSSVLTSKQLIDLISSSKPEQQDECQAYERFIEFISQIEGINFYCTCTYFLFFS